MDDDCYECMAYGDDYYMDDDGNWVKYCPICPHNTDRSDDDE